MFVLPVVGCALLACGCLCSSVSFHLESHACAGLRDALVSLPCGYHSHCVRPCFQWLPDRLLGRRQVLAVLSPLRSCLVAWLCCQSFIMVDQGKLSKLLRIARLRLFQLLQALLTALAWCLVDNPCLLIDWSAQPREPSLPVLSKPWRQVREHTRL